MLWASWWTCLRSCVYATAQVQMLAPMVPGILSFIEQIMQDKELTDSGVRASLGLVGDLCDVYGAHLAAYLKPAMVESLVQYGTCELALGVA